MVHLSDSAVQREAEAQILAGLSAHVGVELVKQRIALSADTWVEVDGAAADLSVLAEAFARQGPMKGGQKRKVALDVLKLITLRRQYPEARLVFGFCDRDAADSLRGWAAEAIRLWEVEIVIVAIDDVLRRRLIEAQTQQFR